MSNQTGEIRVYVGTYTGGASKGIYLCRMDPNTGALSEPEAVAELVNPSFLAIGPAGRWLFAAGERRESAACAFAIDPATGALEPLNDRPSRGGSLCHLAVHRGGRMLIGANYGSGNVTVWPIGPDGRLGEAGQVIQHEGSGAHPKRQAGPHAHSVTFSPDARFAYAADLGIDKVMIYRVDAVGARLEPNDPPFAQVAPGSGPRHMAFHPGRKWAYLINEMGNTITAFGWDGESGGLAEFQTVGTLPEGFAGDSTTADIQVSPCGRFLYGSNRGHDSIAVFAIDPATGRLTSHGHQPTAGRTPRNFALSPAGRFLLAANQDSDNLVSFALDPDAGTLTPTGSEAAVPKPVCVKFVTA